MSPDCCDHRELGKTRADTGWALLLGLFDRENPAEAGESTVAARGGGSARSSGEAPVIGVERRGRPIDGVGA